MRKDLYRSQFRLPQALYDQMKVAADANQRSVNAELVARLEESFGVKTNSGSSRMPQEATVDVLTQMYVQTMKRIAALKSRSALSPQEEIEIQHEEETAKYLRHAVARASAADLSRGT